MGASADWAARAAVLGTTQFVVAGMKPAAALRDVTDALHEDWGESWAGRTTELHGEADVVGPMEPMMDGSWGAPGWLVLALLVVLLALVLGAVTLVVLATKGRSERRRPPSPDEILREGYARGEVGRPQYLEALVDVLKDRYVRGELTLDEYEAGSAPGLAALCRSRQ